MPAAFPLQSYTTRGSAAKAYRIRTRLISAVNCSCSYMTQKATRIEHYDRLRIPSRPNHASRNTDDSPGVGPVLRSHGSRREGTNGIYMAILKQSYHLPRSTSTDASNSRSIQELNSHHSTLTTLHRPVTFTTSSTMSAQAQTLQKLSPLYDLNATCTCPSRNAPVPKDCTRCVMHL